EFRRQLASRRSAASVPEGGRRYPAAERARPAGDAGGERSAREPAAPGPAGPDDAGEDGLDREHAAPDLRPLARGRAAPHAVLLAGHQRVLEALPPHRAAGADPPGGRRIGLVGEERPDGALAARGLEAPAGVVRRRDQLLHLASRRALATPQRGPQSYRIGHFLSICGKPPE